LHVRAREEYGCTPQRANFNSKRTSVLVWRKANETNKEDKSILRRLRAKNAGVDLTRALR
jgi:hypothetical protein